MFYSRAVGTNGQSTPIPRMDSHRAVCSVCGVCLCYVFGWPENISQPTRPRIASHEEEAKNIAIFQ